MYRAPIPATSLSRLRTSLMAVSVVTTLACSTDTATAPSVPSVANATQVTNATPTPERAVQEVARAIALSFNDPLIRVQVRDAMRASVIDEHKLVLQSFLQTANGKAMLQAAARQSRVPVKSIESQIAVLPVLDFYMPIR